MIFISCDVNITSNGVGEPVRAIHMEFLLTLCDGTITDGLKSKETTASPVMSDRERERLLQAAKA